MLPPARVLSEMAALGLRATELGPDGYLPRDPAELRRTLAAHGLGLVGGFVPLVLHEADAGPSLERARDSADLMAAAGADVFVAALVVDDDWSAPVPLDAAGWRRVAARLAELDALVAERGLTLALHPHAGSLLETADDVELALEATGVGWCLDTGHLLIGGVDPARFVEEHAGRIVHVHLKDVDAELAARVRAGELSLLEATRAGLFRPLGLGDAGIGRVVDLLDRAGYERWLVLEQDTAITGEEPPVGDGPMLDVARSIEFLTTPAPTEEITS
jgi:inosose dehydratase